MRWACLLLPHLARDAVLRGHSAQDAKATERCRRFLAAWAYRFSSQVSTVLPDAIVLEIGQSRALFGEWPQVQARLRTELDELGFRHRLAAAPNPHAAWALAHANDGIGVDDAVLVRALGQLAVARERLAGLPEDGGSAAPLAMAEDAERIDTSDMSVEAAIEIAIAAVERRRR